MATDAQVRAFIKQFGELAVAECNRRIAAGEPFILPSVCMAQSALESDWGQAGLMKKANAFFGVKAGGSWTGKIYVADTWEVAENGERYNTVANFRAYDSPAASMADYYALTCGAARYSKALSYGLDKSKWLTPRETITALWAAGYATDDLYVNKIMNTLNGRNMSEWDNLIDGVSTGVAVGSPSAELSIDSFVNGKLVTADSGRSITNDTTVANAIALKWDNAIEIDKGVTYQIIVKVRRQAVIQLAYTTATTAKIERLSDYAITELDDHMVYTINYTPNELITAGIFLTGVTLDDLFSSVTIVNSSFPSTEGSTPSVLAHFIKIE